MRPLNWWALVIWGVVRYTKEQSEDVLQATAIIARVDFFHPAHLRYRRHGNGQVPQADVAANYFRQHQRHRAVDAEPAFADVVCLTKDLLGRAVCNRVARQFLQNDVD